MRNGRDPDWWVMWAFVIIYTAGPALALIWYLWFR